MSEVTSFTVASVEIKILPDKTNSTELVVAGFGGLMLKFSMGSVLSKRMLRLWTVRERDCGIVKLKGVDRNRGQFLSCSDEDRFCFFTI